MISVLSSGVLSVAPGGSAQADAARLVTQFRAAMWVDEIRFTIATPMLRATRVDNGMLLQTRLTLGNREITHGFVPCGILASTFQYSCDSAFANPIETGPVSNTYAFLKWILPVPMYVPAGKALIAQFQRSSPNDSVITGNILAEIGVAGYAGSIRAPRTSKIPFVTAYNNKEVAVSMSQASGQPGTVLYNPFQVPLYVQRFVGRSFVDGVGHAPSDGFLLGEGASAEPNLLYSTAPRVKMMDSDRFPVISEPTPFGEAFSAPWQSWTAPRVLPPKGWIGAQFSNSGTTLNSWIGMIGHREESF